MSRTYLEWIYTLQLRGCQGTPWSKQELAFVFGMSLVGDKHNKVIRGTFTYFYLGISEYDSVLSW